MSVRVEELEARIERMDWLLTEAARLIVIMRATHWGLDVAVTQTEKWFEQWAQVCGG